MVLWTSQAVKSMIAEQVQPLVGDRHATQQQRRSRTSCTRDYEAFMAKHDNAAVHDDALASMCTVTATLTPEVAYWQLREYAAKQRLDFTKPLSRTGVARQQGGQQRPQGTRPHKRRQSQQPMPNGGAPTQGHADRFDVWQTPTMHGITL